MINNLILGHNPFIGINHESQNRGIQKAMKFQNIDSILSFIEKSYGAGIDRMMLSTHPLAVQLCKKIVKSKLEERITFLPLVPYMQKYIRQANESGILNMVGSLIETMGIKKGISALSKAGLAKILNNPKRLIESLIDLEFDCFKKLHCDRVFLHNALTDLAIGLDDPIPIKIFKEYIENRLKLNVGFGTLNLAIAIEQFSAWGLPGEYFMAPFNKLGHQMNPSVKVNLAALQNNQDINILAMSTLASGALRPEEAFQFLNSINNIDSIVVGISSEKHLADTVASFRKFSV
tara:strand:- start:414 stop:1286 length:873 start_codon:yes stop_codon:yes gene_type:complete